MAVPYDPRKHHRRSIRLKGYDYTQPGAYFVTICTWNQELFFDDPNLADVVQTIWCELPSRFPTITLDTFVVMPNHVHFVVWLNPVGASRSNGDGVGASLNGAPTNGALAEFRRPQWNKYAPALGEVVRTFKALVTRRIRQRWPEVGFAWQRNFYESERALQAIRQYIADNPGRWHLDRYNPAATGRDPQAQALWDLLQNDGWMGDVAGNTQFDCSSPMDRG